MDFKEVAAQLRKPDGDFGRKVAENMNISNREMNAVTIQKLAPQEGDNILEIGMGNGFFVKDILNNKTDIKYTGCDFSDAMIAEAETINSKFISKGIAKFVLADAEKLPFRESVFNKVFTVNTIYFWEDPAAQLAEIHRVMKPSGSFILSLRPKHVMQHYPFTQYGFKMYEAEEAAEMLVKNGFVVSEITPLKEADQEFNGTKVNVSSLIITATKPGSI